MNERNGTKPQESTPTDSILNAKVQLLRTRVEAELGKPAVVMITSAHAGDGKSLTAHSLAGCLANYNHRVALVSGSGEEYHDQLSVLEMPRADSNTSREQFAAFVEQMRSEYDFTVIDAEAFVSSSTVMALARVVDGILLAVRIGRAPTEDDEAMVAIIEQFGGRVVGVVASEANTIADFERTRRASPASARTRLRHGAEQNPARALMTSAAERALG